MNIDITSKYPKKKPSELEKKKENKKIINVLKTCLDPELGVSVWDLQLIYDIIKENNNQFHIIMTLTTPLCPYGPQIVSQIKESMKEQRIKANVHLVFSPLWKPSKEVKELLGLSN